MFNFNFQVNDVKRIRKSSSYTNKDPLRGGVKPQQTYKKTQPKVARTSTSVTTSDHSGLRYVKNLYGVVVCVDYSDFFKHSLDSAQGLFEKIFVITNTKDKATEDLCKKYDFVELIKTDIFYKNGAQFDKGSAINLGLSRIPTKSISDWCLIFDADIVFPKHLRQYLSNKPLDTTVLFGAKRYFCRTNDDFGTYLKQGRDISKLSEVYNPGNTPIGYFQLFNVKNLSKPNVKYPEGHIDASSSDLQFSKLFATRTTLRHISVIHLGDDGKNWKGRVTPFFESLACARYPHNQYSEELSTCMSTPVRDLKDDFEFQQFLKYRKIYVSLTTSPKRIDKLLYPLNTINFDVVEKVILSIPEKYRGRQTYEIPDYLSNDSKILINRDFEDVGPLSKLTPALSLLKKIDPDAILITIDDDTIYPYGMCIEMAYEMFKSPKTVVTASAPDLSFWGIPSSDCPNNYTKVSEGFAGISYRVSDIPEEAITEMLQIVKSCPSCKFSDDLVHSFVLSKYDIGVKILSNRYYSLKFVKQLNYGFQDDAIFKASGLPKFKDILKSPDVRPDGVNMHKYKDCINTLTKNIN